MSQRDTRETVPPFPSEPAFGSPEAIQRSREFMERATDYGGPLTVHRAETAERAAETIRDPQRWTKDGGLLVLHPLGEWIHWKDYVALVDPLLADRGPLSCRPVCPHPEAVSGGSAQRAAPVFVGRPRLRHATCPGFPHGRRGTAQTLLANAEQ
jgi:hypothetical protein